MRRKTEGKDALFRQFEEQLTIIMPQLITEMLSHRPEERIYGIAFLTTDDFYGMYAAFETEEHMKALQERLEIDGLRWCPGEWGYSDQELPSDYGNELYKNLVAVIESDKTLDFTQASDEKWAFAESLMNAINKAILELPQSIFEKYGYRKDEIAFLATMSDGDYMEEMLAESAKAFNGPEVSSQILGEQL